MRTVIKFLIDYKSSISALEQSYHLSLSSALGMMSGLEVLFDSVKTIGVFLLLRQVMHSFEVTRQCMLWFVVDNQMLFSALNAASCERFSDLHHTVCDALETFNPWADLDLTSPLACLASSLGITEEIDLSLLSFVNQMNLKPEELQILTLFPTAAAALFVSDRWLKSVYIPPIEAFGDNEHIVPFATAKIAMCFHALLTLHDVQPKSFETSVYSMPRVNKISEEEQKFKLYVDQFLCIASQILLSSRATEVDRSPHLPYRAMGLMLELFIRHCPAVDHGHLESRFPNSLITAGLLEISLGKQTYNDSLGTFSHPTVVAE